MTTTTERADHDHECRDCGSSIPCNGNGETCWDGGNDGCDCARLALPNLDLHDDLGTLGANR